LWLFLALLRRRRGDTVFYVFDLLRFDGYGVAVLGGDGGLGLANLAASIVTLGRTSLSTKVERPSTQVTVQRKGILTPETSR
jgi:hypothetical protein